MPSHFLNMSRLFLDFFIGLFIFGEFCIFFFFISLAALDIHTLHMHIHEIKLEKKLFSYESTRLADPDMGVFLDECPAPFVGFFS